MRPPLSVPSDDESSEEDEDVDTETAAGSVGAGGGGGAASTVTAGAGAGFATVKLATLPRLAPVSPMALSDDSCVGIDWMVTASAAGGVVVVVAMGVVVVKDDVPLPLDPESPEAGVSVADAEALARHRLLLPEVRFLIVE